MTVERPEWTKTVIEVRSKRHPKFTYATGRIAEGIEISQFKNEQEFEVGLDLSEGSYPFVLSIDRSLFKNRNDYRNLLFKISVFLKIFYDSSTYIITPKDIHKTTAPSAFKRVKQQRDAHWWPIFCDVFEKNKMVFRLFAMSTASGLPHPMLNILYSVIALESILLRGEKQESAYKFRVRGAFLMGRTRELRLKYYKILKYAYELRSAIVHANEKERRRIRSSIQEDLGMNTGEFNHELVKINCMLLKGYIKKPATFDELDNIVLELRNTV